MQAQATSTTIAPTVRDLLPEWEIHLRAGNRSKATRDSYLSAVAMFAAYLDDVGMPTEVSKITREHVEAFLAWMLETPEGSDGPRYKASSAKNRHCGIKQFFAWCEEEGEVVDSPMRRVAVPKTVLNPPPVLTDQQVRAILATTEGSAFENRRDRAIILLLVDAGIRLQELTTLTFADVDTTTLVLTVLGKGGKVRTVALNDGVAVALSRYLRARRSHPQARSERLWLGTKGPMTGSGIRQMLERRGEDAGFHVYPHLFRHKWASDFLADGGQENDLMHLAGWNSRQMVRRYGAAAAESRAVAAHRRHSSTDRLTRAPRG